MVEVRLRLGSEWCCGMDETELVSWHALGENIDRPERGWIESEGRWNEGEIGFVRYSRFCG